MPYPELQSRGTRMASGIAKLATWHVNGVFFKLVSLTLQFHRAGLGSRFANARGFRVEEHLLDTDVTEYSFWVDLHARRSALGEGKVGTTATPARTRKIIPFCCCGDVPQFQMMRLPLKADDRSRAAKNAVLANKSLTACEIFHKVSCNRFTPPTFSALTLTSRSMPQADFPTFASTVS